MYQRAASEAQEADLSGGLRSNSNSSGISSGSVRDKKAADVSVKDSMAYERIELADLSDQPPRDAAPAYRYDDGTGHLLAPGGPQAQGQAQAQGPPPPPPPPGAVSSYPPRFLRDGQNRIFNTAVNLVLVACAVALLVFAGVVAHLDGKVPGTVKHRHTISILCNRLATLFPILFAVVVGGAARQLATWWLERGIRLRPLELLLGSTTVGGTVITAFQLRALADWTCLLALAVWALSPLGSQSSLQMIDTEVSAITAPLVTYYLDTAVTNVSMWGDALAGTGFLSGDVYFLPSLDSIYNTALIQSESRRLAPQDIWGNVKIPDLARETARLGRNDSGWVIFGTVEEQADSNETQYASLMGLPFLINGSSTLPTDVNTTFTVESAYLAIDCTAGAPVDNATDQPDCTQLSGTNVPNGTFYGAWSNDTETDWKICTNGFYNASTWGVYNIVASFGNTTGADNTSTTALASVPPARSLLFLSATNIGYDGVTGAYYWAQCPMKTAYVESEVACLAASGTCAVTAMRESQQAHPHENLTDLSFYGAFTSVAEDMVASIGSDQHVATSSLTEYFLADPSQVILAGTEVVNWTNVTTEAFSQRFQQVVNTFWYGSYGPDKFTGISLGVSTTRLPGDEVNSLATMRHSPGASSRAVDVYAVRWGWWVVFVGASLVIGLAGVLRTALVLFYTRAPDVLGFAASMVSTSPYVPLGYGLGSSMSGPERAREFGDVHVRLMDVDPTGETGFVAVAETGCFDGAPLRDDRMYR